MESNSPFEKLPAEFITIILSITNSPADIQSIIRADPYIWRVFLQHKRSILRPFVQDLVSQYTRPYLTHLAMACRLRAIERKFYAQSRDQVEKVVKPILTSSQEPFSVTQFNLGPMSEVYHLHRETDVSVVHYSKEAWEMTQDMAAREAEKDLPKLPLSLPLSETEAQKMQEAHLLFEAFRHSICFRTSFLQHYDSGEPASPFHIPWKFYYQDKLLRIRAFQAVFVFLFKEHEKLLNRIHDRITGPACLSRIENSDTDWRIQRQPFLQRGQRDSLQFIAYLCSQGYHQLLSIQDRNNISQEHILFLYRRYQALKGDRRNCPMVVGADLEYSLKTLCCDTGRGHEFWTSGAYMWDMERLSQLGEELVWLATDLRDEFY